MYTKITFVIFILSSFLSYSQLESGRVIYKLKFEEEMLSPAKGKFENNLSEIKKYAQEMEFKLIFNQTKSQFSLVKQFSTKEDLNFKAAKLIFGGKSKYYTDLVKKEVIEEKDFLDKTFFVSRLFSEMNWDLTNESKEISGYDCYKAQGYRETMGRDFKIKRVDLTAWYTPEIPLNYGPYEATGLPGLVLELKVKNHSLVASKISFENEIKFDKLKKGKYLSKNEFDIMIRDIAKSKRGQ